MEVLAAGEDVGARESLERELCSVRAAADRLYLRFEACVAHSLFGDTDYLDHRLDLLAHVVVLVLDLYRAAAGIFHVGLAHEMLDLALAAFETGTVVVADYICKHGLLDGTFDFNKMVEAFVAFGMLGCLPAGQHGYEIVGNADGVYHLVLGIAGMHVAALDSDLG